MSVHTTYTVGAPTDAALPPPKGLTPAFEDPFTLRPYHNVTFSLGILFSGIFLAARIYTKARVVRQLRWEDCKFRAITLVCSILTKYKIPVS